MKDTTKKITPYGFLEDEETLWITLSDRNTLICINKNTDEIEDMFIECGYITDLEAYRRIVKVGDELLLVPCNSDYYVIYDLKKKTFCYEQIRDFAKPSNEEYLTKVRFTTAIANRSKAYMFGGFYPAVVKYDYKSKEFCYYTDWIEEIDSMTVKGDACGHFGKDCMIQDDTIIVPVACTNGILLWNTKNDTYRTMFFDDGFRGYYSIAACNKKSIWLSSRYSADKNYIVNLELGCDSITKIELPYANKNTLYSLLGYNETIFAIPESHGHIYAIDTIEKKARIATDIEKLVGNEAESGFFTNTIIDSKLRLVNKEDSIWHEIDLQTMKSINKSHYDKKMKDVYYASNYINRAAENGIILGEDKIELEPFLRGIIG